jgi:hypothetical protein
VSKGQSNLVTIIGEGYLQPIADLVEKWLARRPPPPPNRVQSGFYENGYAAAGVLLLVAMFESYVSRLRYIQDAKGKAVPTNMRKATEVVHHVFPHLRHKKALADVYVLRDVLIHSHLWEICYQYGGSHPMGAEESDEITGVRRPKVCFAGEFGDTSHQGPPLEHTSHPGKSYGCSKGIRYDLENSS